MHKKFEINWTNIKGGCQSGRKVLPYDFKSDLPLSIGKTNSGFCQINAFYVPTLNYTPLIKNRLKQFTYQTCLEAIC